MVALSHNVLRLGGRFNAAKPLLCSRCGSFSSKFQSEQGFLLFFLGLAKNIVIENQHFSYKITNKRKIFVKKSSFYLVVTNKRLIFVSSNNN